MASKKTASLPEWRACTDEESPSFGAVAVRKSGHPWRVMHPEVGGHTSNPEEVRDWQKLTTVDE